MLIATLTDQDGLHELNPPGILAATTWQWARSTDGVSGWMDISGATAGEYQPKLADADHFLRATATYWDSESFENPRSNYADNFKTASEVSVEKVSADRIANDPPDFGEFESDGETQFTALPAVAEAGNDQTDYIVVEDPLRNDGADNIPVEANDGDEDAGVEEPRYFLRTAREATEITPGYRRVGENAVPGQPVGNPVVAMDDNDDTLTYSLYTGDRGEIMGGVMPTIDEDYFVIDPVTGQITLAPGVQLDYDVDNAATMHPKREYTVTVLATDPFFTPLDVINGVGLTGDNGELITGAAIGTTDDGVTVNEVTTQRRSLDWIDVTIYVVPVDENPSIPNVLTVPADTMQGPGTIDHPENFTYIDVDGDPDEDNNGMFDITVDENGTVTIEEDEFIPPIYYMADPEDNGTVKRWFLGGPDGSKFRITATPLVATPAAVGGVLTFVSAPNYESPGDANGDNVYDIMVIAADAAANIAQKRVTVKVTNMREPGTITLSAWQPEDGIPLTTTLMDRDGGATGVVWQWYRTTGTYVKNNDGTYPPLYATRTTDNTAETQAAADANNALVWVKINNPGAQSDSYTPNAHRTDTATDELWKGLSVTATYTDNSGVVDSAQVDSEYPVQISDTNNKPPEFATTSDVRSVNEGVADAVVGPPITAREDQDDDDEFVLTYWLSGSDASYFTIEHGDVEDNDATTEVDETMVGGQIRTAKKLDYETKPTYNVTVTVRDPSYNPTSPSSVANSVDTINVVISLIQVDESPSLGGLDRLVYMENGTGPVGTYTSTDPEGNDIGWSVTGTDASYFSINGGVLTFDSPPNYEQPPDAPADNLTESREARNVYEITVEASDGGQGTTKTKDVLVKVTNVDDPGTVTLSAVQPVGDQPILQRATLNDEDGYPPEGIIAATSWTWAKSMDQQTWTNVGATRDYRPKATDVGYYLRARALYWDGESFENPDPNTVVKTAEAVTSQPVDSNRVTNRTPSFGDTLTAGANRNPRPVGLGVEGTGDDARLVISDADDDDDGPPYYMSGFHEYTEILPGVRRIGENARPGQPVGNRTMAKDADKDNLTYSLREFDPGDPLVSPYTNVEIDNVTEALLATHEDDYKLFQIDQVTGQISLASGTSLDFEDQNVFIVRVMVTDPFWGRSIAPDAELPTDPEAAGTPDTSPANVQAWGAFDTIDLIIEVVDVDENPSVPAPISEPPRMAIINERADGTTDSRGRYLRDHQ